MFSNAKRMLLSSSLWSNLQTLFETVSAAFGVQGLGKLSRGPPSKLTIGMLRQFSQACSLKRLFVFREFLFFSPANHVLIMSSSIFRAQEVVKGALKNLQAGSYKGDCFMASLFAYKHSNFFVKVAFPSTEQTKLFFVCMLWGRLWEFRCRGSWFALAWCWSDSAESYCGLPGQSRKGTASWGKPGTYWDVLRIISSSTHRFPVCIFCLVASMLNLLTYVSAGDSDDSLSETPRPPKPPSHLNIWHWFMKRT